MDPGTTAIGIAIWLITAVSYAVYRVRLRSSRFTSGIVISIDERLIAGELGWSPTIRYRTSDGGEAEFQSRWGIGRDYWCVGESVDVKIYDDSPEIHDPRLIRGFMATGIVFGLVFILLPLIQAPA